MYMCDFKKIPGLYSRPHKKWRDREQRGEGEGKVHGRRVDRGGREGWVMGRKLKLKLHILIYRTGFGGFYPLNQRRCLTSQPRLVPIYRPLEDERLGWPGRL